MEDQWKIEVGESIEKVMPQLEEWLDKRIDSANESLINRDFSNIKNICKHQEKIKLARDLKAKLKSFVKDKNKILAERRKDNS